MKRSCLFLIAAFMMLAASCSSHHYDQFLSSQDSILLSNPKLVLQNLEEVNPHDYKGRDEAYYNLLLTMARDKNFYRFEDDSLISASQKWFCHSHDLYNQARSTLYLGLVRYRIDTRDGTVPELLLEAGRLFDESGSNELSVPALIESYLGLVYNSSSDWKNAEIHQRKCVSLNRRRRDSSNLVISYVDLSRTMLSAGRFDEARKSLDSAGLILKNGKGLEYEESYVSAMAQNLYYSGEYGPSLEWARKWRTSGGYETRKAQLMSKIFQKLGETDSALIYKQAAIDTRRQDDSLYYYVHYKGLAELYAEKGDFEKAYTESSCAFDWLVRSIDKRNGIRIAELEKKYDISRDYVTKSEMRQSRQASAIIILALLLIAAVAAAFYFRTVTRKRELERSLTNEQLLRRIATATAIPVSGLLPELNKLSNKVFSNDAEKVDLSDKIINLVKAVRDKQTNEFKSIINDYSSSFSPALITAMNLFKSDSYKIVIYLTEQGYNSTEIAGMTGMSAAGVRAIVSQARQAILESSAFTDGMPADLKILRQQ